MKTTMRDVAEAAGVSAMAVSAVLHGTGRNVKVSETKAALIRKVAQELRYQPNQMARSLRNSKTNTIGVVFQHFGKFSDDNPYYPALLNGIIGVLFPAKYTLALCPHLVARSNEGAISDGRFDGVLWCRPDFTDESVEGLRLSSTPVVMMHAPPGSAPGVPTFCADNDGALRLAVNHLSELGHKRIGFVIDHLTEPTAEGRARSNAFLEAIKEGALEGEVLIWDNNETHEVQAYKDGKGPHTALIAYSDFLAGRLLTACLRFQVQVPLDLSIVGFDSSPFCETTIPKLTSIYQPVEEMAEEATTYLLSLIKADKEATDAKMEPPQKFYTCRLDKRGSTAPPRVVAK